MNQKSMLLMIFCIFFQFSGAAKHHDYKLSGTIYSTTDGADSYEALAGTALKLYGKIKTSDGSFSFKSADLLGEAVTDAQGKFVITGSRDEEDIRTSEPFIFLNFAWRAEYHVTAWFPQEIDQPKIIIYLGGNKVNVTADGKEVLYEYRRIPSSG